jgi:hypothetical protein
MDITKTVVLSLTRNVAGTAAVASGLGPGAMDSQREVLNATGAPPLLLVALAAGLAAE